MSSARKWIGTSWKMNKTLPDAMAFAQTLAQAPGARDIQRFIIPPFTAVRQVRDALAQTDIMVGAQNMHWADAGAWTGEISAPMLVDCGLQMVELGHSERRTHFGETDETVGLKVLSAIRHGLVPLICIGETAQDRDADRATEVLAHQVRGALSKLNKTQKQAPMLFAYEPVWAIGAGGTPASAEYADARQAEIAGLASDLCGQRVACLYGGSVTSENCAELITRPHIDGLFIGRAAWNADGYLDILARCAVALDRSPHPEHS